MIFQIAMNEWLMNRETLVPVTSGSVSGSAHYRALRCNT